MRFVLMGGGIPINLDRQTEKDEGGDKEIIQTLGILGEKKK